MKFVDIKNFNIIKHLGSGAHGDVYKVKDLNFILKKTSLLSHYPINF